ncbi:MAG: hypothetical protein M3461_09905 [Pseudomonadota bacterium]|nr:hypothetical protein [Pseudomonadota bacterium]
MHIQALRLEGSEAVGDLQELLAHGGQMGKAFPEPEVREIVRADLIAQESRELLVLLDEPVLPNAVKSQVWIAVATYVLVADKELAKKPRATAT